MSAPPPASTPSILDRVATAVLVLVYVLHLGAVAALAVDVPFWDDWEALAADALPAGLTIDWLLAPHNEHRILPTKLLTWLLHRTTGWDLRLAQVLGFLIYGLVLLQADALLRAAGLRPSLRRTALLFLVSGIAGVNHLWAFQSQMNFTLLFFLLAVRLLFLIPSPGGRGGWSSALGVACALLGMWSSSAGVLAAVALPVLLVLPPFDRIGSSRRAACLAAGGVAAGLLAWAVTFHRPTYGPPVLAPWQPEAWRFFLDLVGHGFGIDRLGAGHGLVALALVLVPALALASAERRIASAPGRAVLAAVLGMLLVCAGVALGRGGGRPIDAKASRYAEFPALLVPLALAAATRAWGDGPAGVALAGAKAPGVGALLRPATQAAILGLALLGYADDWSIEPYRRERAKRLEGLRCIRERWQESGADLCPTLYPRPLGDRLDRAAELGIPFARREMPAR